MSIASYTDLQAAVAAWLGRTDLTAVIPDFIALAENDIARNLRKQVVRTPLTLDSAEVTLPAACAELRSVRLDTSNRQYPLNATTAENLATLRRVGSGVPNAYAVVDGVLLLDITPSDDMTAEIVYFEALVPLSDEAPSNSTLTNSPDIYLFGSLKEAELYLEHDERNPVWTAKYRQAVEAENASRERSELGAAPMVMRLPVVF